MFFLEIFKCLIILKDSDMRYRLDYMNPSGDTLIKLLDHFRSIHGLENMIIYTADSIDFLGHTSVQKLVKSIHSIDQLLNHLQLLSGNGLDSVRIQSLRKVELFFNATNDLLILKCSRFKLDAILRIYSRLKNKSKLTSFRRVLIWLPESSEHMTPHATAPQSDEFHIYRFNWLVDVDKTLVKLIEQTFALDIRQMKAIYMKQKLAHPEFTESNLLNELFTVGTFRFLAAAAQTEYRFKVAHNKIIHLKPQESNEDVFARFKSDIEEPMDTTLIKPVYRIVLKQVEPYIYASQLDDENTTTTNTGECKDGLICLKFDSDEIKFSHGLNQLTNVSLDDELQNLFNKEFIVSIVKGFKAVTGVNANKYKKQCCTGYIINLLQRLAADLDFDMELYFAAENKYGGALKHVAAGLAHIVAGPFSVTEERARHIDFSTPFLHSGYAILIKQEKKGVNDLFMFMQPFTNLHWLIIVLFGLTSAFSLSLLEFNSPFGLNPTGRQRARNYTLGSGISMVISLMFMHTMPAKSPKSWAGK